eukprot:scaffold661996_cov59-Prasinocladus_malaysianus.AAC.1
MPTWILAIWFWPTPVHTQCSLKPACHLVLADTSMNFITSCACLPLLTRRDKPPPRTKCMRLISAGTVAPARATVTISLGA